MASIREAVIANSPLFDLLDINYVNVENSFILSDGEDLITSNKCYLEVVVNKTTKPLLKIVAQSIKTEYSDIQINDICNYYIVFDNKELKVEAFAVKHKGRIYVELDDLIVGTLMYSKKIDENLYKQLKNKADTFSCRCCDWLKLKINMLMPDVKGRFLTDRLQESLYTQRRTHESDNYDYIISNWSAKINKGKPIEWVDFMDGGKIFIAL